MGWLSCHPNWSSGALLTKLTDSKAISAFFFFSRTHKDKSQHTISNRVWPLGDHMAPHSESPDAFIKVKHALPEWHICSWEQSWNFLEDLRRAFPLRTFSLGGLYSWLRRLSKKSPEDGFNLLYYWKENVPGQNYCRISRLLGTFVYIILKHCSMFFWRDW